MLFERKPTKQPFALLFLDLNKFKPLNDTFGHDKGDRALFETAQRIQSVLRDHDVVARLGGDEFVVLLREVKELSDVEKIIARLHEEIQQPLDFCDGFSLGASIGLAMYPEHGQDGASLLNYADQEMYNDKQRTRTVR
ncbi:diguanylate cyclase domain-containing protein [Thiopseudomonas acetoxidans]|uniref:GGDEF domain-containing protein n=1 Tax=Thiopseudomonas acetoxidans TaxID=3041622 RepID=A0ABT7SQE9_9GAMM|nr:GGDEF domain-containing protein [Thiopseudomonas sp. CY1220]MDM7858418.1 GGDEF domain-containing protein [Thiopseudomonas sp. CY1220]